MSVAVSRARRRGGRLVEISGLGRRAGIGGLRRCAIVVALDPFLEHGVLLQLLLHEIDELHARELEQLDRLLQLRSHHQLLAEADLLFELKRHDSGVPMRAGSSRPGRSP